MPSNRLRVERLATVVVVVLALTTAAWPTALAGTSVILSAPFDNFRIECPQGAGAQRLNIHMLESQGLKRQDAVYTLSCNHIDELYGAPAATDRDLEREDCRYGNAFDPIVESDVNATCSPREYITGIVRIAETRIQIECCRLRSRDETACVEKTFAKPFGADAQTEIKLDAKLINSIAIRNHRFIVRFCDLAPRNHDEMLFDVRTIKTTTKPLITTTEITTESTTTPTTAIEETTIVEKEVIEMLQPKKIIKIARKTALSHKGNWSTTAAQTITDAPKPADVIFDAADKVVALTTLTNDLPRRNEVAPQRDATHIAENVSRNDDVAVLDGDKRVVHPHSATSVNENAQKTSDKVKVTANNAEVTSSNTEQTFGATSEVIKNTILSIVGQSESQTNEIDAESKHIKSLEDFKLNLPKEPLPITITDTTVTTSSLATTINNTTEKSIRTTDNDLLTTTPETTTIAETTLSASETTKAATTENVETKLTTVLTTHEEQQSNTEFIATTIETTEWPIQSTSIRTTKITAMNVESTTTNVITMPTTTRETIIETIENEDTGTDPRTVEVEVKQRAKAAGLPQMRQAARNNFDSELATATNDNDDLLRETLRELNKASKESNEDEQTSSPTTPSLNGEADDSSEHYDYDDKADEKRENENDSERSTQYPSSSLAAAGVEKIFSRPPNRQKVAKSFGVHERVPLQEVDTLDSMTIVQLTTTVPPQLVKSKYNTETITPSPTSTLSPFDAFPSPPPRSSGGSRIARPLPRFEPKLHKDAASSISAPSTTVANVQKSLPRRNHIDNNAKNKQHNAITDSSDENDSINDVDLDIVTTRPTLTTSTRFPSKTRTPKYRRKYSTTNSANSEDRDDYDLHTTRSITVRTGRRTTTLRTNYVSGASGLNNALGYVDEETNESPFDNDTQQQLPQQKQQQRRNIVSRQQRRRTEEALAADASKARAATEAEIAAYEAQLKQQRQHIIEQQESELQTDGRGRSRFQKVDTRFAKLGPFEVSAEIRRSPAHYNVLDSSLDDIRQQILERQLARRERKKMRMIPEPERAYDSDAAVPAHDKPRYNGSSTKTDNFKDATKLTKTQMSRDGARQFAPADNQPIDMPDLIVYDTLDAKNLPWAVKNVHQKHRKHENVIVNDLAPMNEPNSEIQNAKDEKVQRQQQQQQNKKAAAGEEQHEQQERQLEEREQQQEMGEQTKILKQQEEQQIKEHAEQHQSEQEVEKQLKQQQIEKQQLQEQEREQQMLYEQQLQELQRQINEQREKQRREHQIKEKLQQEQRPENEQPNGQQPSQNNVLDTATTEPVSDANKQDEPKPYNPAQFYYVPQNKRQMSKLKEKVLTFCSKETAIRDVDGLIIACGDDNGPWRPNRCPPTTACFVANDATYHICCPYVNN